MGRAIVERKVSWSYELFKHFFVFVEFLSSYMELINAFLHSELELTVFKFNFKNALLVNLDRYMYISDMT